MCWLSMFLGMQTERRLPSSDIVLNYDLHKQAFYMCSTTTTFFFNGNLQMCGELKELLLVSCWAAISLQRSFTAPWCSFSVYFWEHPTPSSWCFDGFWSRDGTNAPKRVVHLMTKALPDDFQNVHTRQTWSSTCSFL